MSDIEYLPASDTPHLHNWLMPGMPVGENDHAIFACDACGTHVEERGEYWDMERWLAGLYDQHATCHA